MVDTKRFIFPLLFRVALVALACCGALAQDPQRADDDRAAKESLELLVPPKLPSVKFGDPVYVPLTIRNAADKAVTAPLFRYHNPDFAYIVRSGDARAECSDYGQGFGRGNFHTLPARSVETTVLMVNIWAPAIAIQFRKTGEARIDFSAYLSSEPDWPGLKATTIVKLAGRDPDPFPEVAEEFTAFNEEGLKRLLTLARKLSCAEDYLGSWESDLSAGRATSDVFARGQSPLNWLDPRNDNDDSWDVESKFYKEAKAMVHLDSALYRMITFTELRHELRGVNPKPTRTSIEALDAYFVLLEKCPPWERHFQIVALNGIAADHFPITVREPEMRWSELCTEIRRRAPEYSMYFLATGNFRASTYSTISLLGHSGAK